jgi:hypothetical protein
LAVAEDKLGRPGEIQHAQVLQFVAEKSNAVGTLAAQLADVVDRARSVEEIQYVSGAARGQGHTAWPSINKGTVLITDHAEPAAQSWLIPRARV